MARLTLYLKEGELPQFSWSYVLTLRRKECDQGPWFNQLKQILAVATIVLSYVSGIDLLI